MTSSRYPASGMVLLCQLTRTRDSTLADRTVFVSKIARGPSASAAAVPGKSVYGLGGGTSGERTPRRRRPSARARMESASARVR